MAKWTEEYRKMLETSEGRKVSRQEQLLFDATELICRALADERVSRAELARRIGKSKPFVTQLLRGQNNMTLRTLSDLANALGYDVELGAVNPATANRICIEHWNGPTRCQATQSHYTVNEDPRTPDVNSTPEEHPFELQQRAA